MSLYSWNGVIKSNSQIYCCHGRVALSEAYSYYQRREPNPSAQAGGFANEKDEMGEADYLENCEIRLLKDVSPSSTSKKAKTATN